jgi:hypothetical protein
LAVTALAGCGTPSRGDAPTPAAVATPAAPPVVIVPKYGTRRLARSEHPLARPSYDKGRLDPEKTISNVSLMFALSPEQKKDRDALAAAQLDPKSPEYHRWLVPDTYRARFGAKAEDIERARQWLGEQGLVVHETSPLGTRVSFSGKVKDLEAAFQTEMHRYEVGGQMHYAMATAPALPDALASVTLGLHNTHDFVPKPVSQRRNQEAMQHRTRLGPHYEINFPGGPDGGFQVLGPPDWAAAYDVAQLYDPGIGGKKLDGTGVTIGIVGTAEIAQSDIAAFRTTFSLPATTVNMILVPNTGTAAGGQGGGGGEAILDVEWSGGIAKGATVDYVYVGDQDYNVDDATFYIIEQNHVSVMSESYGGCEAGTLATDADITEQYGTAANLMGITYMAAAGDDGAADCVEQGQPGLYIDLPGGFPGVTSVGGTQFPSPGWNAQGNLTAYPTLEQVWNESNDPYSQYGVGAGGGGISTVFLRPTYQAAVPSCVPNGTLPSPSGQPMRQVPDVAFSAASGTPGYFVECTFDDNTGDCSATGGDPMGSPIGGTSASSPSFAGLVAILTQAVGERLGNINPILYALQAAAPAAPPFHDITSGNNQVVCGEAGAGDAGGADGGIWPDAGCGEGGLYGYNAITGFDCASGLGSVDGYNLVSAWLGAAKTDTTLVPMPTETMEGGDVTLTATINVDGANANALGGSVTFAFQTFTLSGTPDLSWELGTTTITAGTTTGGQAVLVTKIPPGVVNPGHQVVDVYALYSGDEHHLASRSADVQVTFEPFSFAIVPATVDLQVNGTESFTTTGGVPPVRWYVDVDTTFGFTANGPSGASIGEADGGFVAGPQAGYVEISALDSDGAEAFAKITVGNPTVPPPWADAGTDAGQVDAGHDSGVHDAGHDATKDAGKPLIKDAAHPIDVAHVTADAGEPEEKGGGGGCSCEVAESRRESSLSGILGIAFGLAFVSRRRARRP